MTSAAMGRGPRAVAHAPAGTWTTVAATLVAVALLTAAFAALAAVVGEPFGFFSKEPAETLAAPAFVGWFAHLVALLWAVAATTSAAAGAVLCRVGARSRGRMYLAAAGLTVVLLADDLLLLHESVYPRLGLHEEAVYAFYVVLGLAFLAAHHRELVRTGLAAVGLLVGAFLGLSVLIDLSGTGTRHLLEDGAKAAGAALWATGLARAAHTELVTRLTAAADETAVAPADDAALPLG